MGRKSEAPRAARLAEAFAPPEATPGSEGDPPSIVPRALAFVSTNDIARRSLRFGGRSAFADELPGCPVPSPTVKPLRFPRPPVSRRPLPPPRLPARLPGRPAHLPSLPVGSPEGSQRGFRTILLPAPLSPREPGWPSAPRDRHCWLPRLCGTVPRVPVGMRCPVRGSLSSLNFRWSRGSFALHRVIRRESRLHTELFRSSTVHPQVVHR